MSSFIIPGALSHLHDYGISNFLNAHVCGILIHEKRDAENVADEIRSSGEFGNETAGKVFTLNSLVRLTSESLGDQQKQSYETCLNAVLNDQRVHYLATRSYFNSAFNNAIVIEKIVTNSIFIIGKTKPSRLIACSTPHSLEAWVFAKCFECLNLPVYILERSPIFSRAWIYRGLDTQDVVRLGKKGTKEKILPEAFASLIETQRNSGAGLRDKNGFYVSRLEMESVKGANSNDWWSYSRELTFLTEGKIGSLPFKLVSFYLKKRLFESYSALSISKLPASPFVVYFMHYQPERTSLPEALGYVQQWNTIRLLSSSLPDGWTLLVREHPETWLSRLDISVRTKSLYQEISLLRNTKLCSMEVDTFELIDKSEAVATLTGHVGFQAILRNKPIIAFGLPPYKDHPGCFPIKTFDDLRCAFRTIEHENLEGRFSDEALWNYFSWVGENSICGDVAETDWLEARLKGFGAIYKQIFSGDVELQ